MFFVIISCFAYANDYDFEVDGIYYKITSETNREICVTNPTDLGLDRLEIYIGAWSIPSTVTYNGINYTVSSIDYQAFRSCRLTSISLPNTLVTIGDEAFCSTYIETIIIPNSVNSIGKSVFSNCHSLRSISLSGQLSSIPDGAFGSCELLSDITIPNSVTSIGQIAFIGCENLKSINIPDGVKTIGGSAFNKTGLSSVSIPSSVNRIDYSAFYGCQHLENVYSYVFNPFNIGDGVFKGISSTATLHLPQGTTSQYQEYPEWTQYFSAIVDDLANPNPPVTTYTLSIRSTGNGTANYGGSAIRGRSSSFTVNEGASVTVTFEPDTGYRIQSVKVNNSDVTSKLSNNTYTFNVTSDTSVEVVFEAIPKTTYTLTLTATGNGTANYGGSYIRERSSSFTVNDGTSVTVTFEPDTGYRVKSAKVNGSDITSKLSNNSYTFNVTSDTSVEVVFEAIPQDPDTPKTYTLSIRAKGNGIATYNGETIRATTKTYTLEEGTKFTITFTPDEGNQISSLRVNGAYVTVSDTYEAKITADTSIKIDFEEIPVDPEPPVTYTLSIKSIGNGSATFGRETIRNNTSTFTLNEGTLGTIIFTPDEGWHIESLMVDGSTIGIANSYSFTMDSDKTVEVVFEETIIETNIIVDGNNYEILSHHDHTLKLIAEDFDYTLIVPDKIEYQGEEWTVTGIDDKLLDGHEDLAAIIWDIEGAFTARVNNPNLLLYVKDEQYAPATIKNVVVNGYANSITLIDASSGNNFYCPRAFTAGIITYSHRYWMKTGINESRGWETIALPFDVQKISHSTKGEIIPFANWQDGDATYPFWLYQLSGNGFIEADAIKANTPYIISMPNNDRYSTEYHLSGRVDFTAKNVEVKKSDDIHTSAFSDRTFIPNFVEQGKNAGYYALNVNNEYEVYQGEEAEGSKFVLNLRQIHPFESYMTSSANTRSIGVFDDMTTNIRGIEILADDQMLKVYDLSGKLLKVGSSIDYIKQGLPAGVYIVNRQKLIIK